MPDVVIGETTAVLPHSAAFTKMDERRLEVRTDAVRAFHTHRTRDAIQRCISKHLHLNTPPTPAGLGCYLLTCRCWVSVGAHRLKIAAVPCSATIDFLPEIWAEDTCTRTDAAKACPCPCPCHPLSPPSHSLPPLSHFHSNVSPSSSSTDIILVSCASSSFSSSSTIC